MCQLILNSSSKASMLDLNIDAVRTELNARGDLVYTDINPFIE
jgi:hypothetical protein